jgi:DNA-binding transcriptional regulator LsrR (DeoR family)
MGNPVTLFQAYRLLWNVELVVADPGGETTVPGEADQELLWRDVLDKAAWYINGVIAQRAHACLAEGERLRVAVTWGREMHELIEAMAQVPRRLARLDETHTGLARPLADEHFLVPRNVLAVPTVGIFGTTDPRNEANHNAQLLASLWHGEAALLPRYAFCDERYREAGQQALDTGIAADWNRLDLGIFTCDELRKQMNGNGPPPLPGMLYRQMEQDTVGEIGGMYVSHSGAEAKLKHYARIGMTHEHFRQLARRSGSMLIAGMQSRRLAPALAALRGGLVSTLVTDLNFAWQLLRTHAEQQEVQTWTPASRTRVHV